MPDAQQVRTFGDTNNHDTIRMIRAFVPLFNDGGRFILVANSFGTLASLDPRLHPRFDVGRDEPGRRRPDHRRLSGGGGDLTGRRGRMAWLEQPTVEGQMASLKVWAARQPSRTSCSTPPAQAWSAPTPRAPWFDDMSGALSPDEAAVDVLWLATPPAGTRKPCGELVQRRKVLPFTPVASGRPGNLGGQAQQSAILRRRTSDGAN